MTIVTVKTGSTFGFTLRLSLVVSMAVLGILAGCATAPSTNTPTKQAAYAMPDRYSAEVVQQVLAQGGNAVDAAIAAGFVLAVTFPEAGNIGGGGFMLARMYQKNHFLDYREVAPMSASRDMYLDENGKVTERASLIGAQAAGVPGTVAGMWEAHKKFGTKPWRELIQPAIALAKDGFEVHPKKAKGIPGYIEWFGGDVNFEEHFGAMAKGGLFKQPELAATLTRIAELGPEDFYQGETAKLLVNQSEKEGGLITLQDLADYKPVWRTALTASWRDFEVVTAPPPSSGGFAVIQLLKMKQALNNEFDGLAHNSPQYVHLVAEMEKRVFSDRAEYFGDPDFVDVPMKMLISDDYISRRAAEVNTKQISELDAVQPGLESPSTTHYSIVDKWGNAVANTYTLNWSYGSGVVVEGAGFILNNEMDDFSTKPGIANAYGVVGGVANEIQPKKRMLSSMSPTLLLQDGDVKMAIGTPGGSTIFTSVFQGIVNVLDFGMSAQEASSVSRFHHQLLPPELITTSVTVPFSEDSAKALEAMGYRVEKHGWEFGDLQIIYYPDENPDTGSDTRGIGASGRVQ